MTPSLRKISSSIPPAPLDFLLFRGRAHTYEIYLLNYNCNNREALKPRWGLVYARLTRHQNRRSWNKIFQEGWGSSNWETAYGDKDRCNIDCTWHCKQGENATPDSAASTKVYLMSLFLTWSSRIINSEYFLRIEIYKRKVGESFFCLSH